MKTAVNYSSEAESLLGKGEIEMDVFKCPDFDDALIETAQMYGPAYVHFPVNAGSGELNKVDWSKIERLKDKTRTPFINAHLIVTHSDFPDIPVNTTDKAHQRKVIDALIKDVSILTDRFGPDKVIVENVVCRGPEGKVLRPVIEPGVITQVVEETKCGLLLDTAHAQMTSKCLGIDVYDYVSRLPVDRLRELHITGIQHDGNKYRDSMPMTDDDWALAEWVMSNIKQGHWPEPWVASLEYGGVGPLFEWRTDAEVLAKQVPKFYHLVKS